MKEKIFKLILVIGFIIVYFLIILGAPNDNYIGKETEFLDVIVNDVYTDKDYNGITWTTDYIIEVAYDGEILKIEDYDLYMEYKSKIGEETKAAIQIKTYEDGSIKKEILALD